jgi:hypothetical protein
MHKKAPAQRIQNRVVRRLAKRTWACALAVEVGRRFPEGDNDENVMWKRLSRNRGLAAI